MKKDEYISISEFSKRAGVSRPTIYAKLENELSSFTKSVNSKTLINTKALELFNVKESVKNFTDFESLKDFIEVLQEQAQALKKELDIKNEQIRSLSTALDQQQKLHLVSEQKWLSIETKSELEVQPETDCLINPDKVSEAEHVQMLLALIPKRRLWHYEQYLADERRYLSKLSEREKELLLSTGWEPNLEYLKDPSVK